VTHKILHVTPAHGGSAEVECLHCGTTMTVTLDEDGAPDFATEPCHADDCNARLCPNCPQFNCDGCGLAHCLEHKIELSGVWLCPVCIEEDSDVCECVPIDVDRVDASGCPLHGRHHHAA
jgi:hypothetical protein